MKCPDPNNMPARPTFKITKRNLVAKWDDSDFHDWCVRDLEFDFVIDAISVAMNKINPHSNLWYCLGYNLGWQHKDGVMPDFQADNARNLLSKILPKTECTFKVIKVRNKLIITNSHHDAMGEVYVIVPVK
jgi:hypothetical protein